MGGQELITRKTLSQIAAAWEESKREIVQGCALIASATGRLQETLTEDHPYRFAVGVQYRYDRVTTEPDKIIEELRREVWEHLVNRAEVRRVLSIARAKSLDKSLSEGKLENGAPLPEITEETLWNFVQSFAQNVEAFMEDAVKEVFDFLRPGGYMKDYKTNAAFTQELGERCILGWAVESNWKGGHRVNYNKNAEIRALDNVFHLLDGKGAVPTYNGPLHDAIEACQKGKGETEYFAFKCFGNGNLHLQFRRVDLLKKLNAIAGGMTLKTQNR